MAQNGLAGLEQALQEDYVGALRTIVYEPSETYNKIKVNSTDFSGLEYYMAVQVTPYLNTGARGEFQDLAPASSPGVEDLRGKAKTQTARLLWSAQEIDQTEGPNAASFVRTTTFKIKAAAERLRRDTNRQFWGTSDGVLASTAVTTASNVVNLAATTPLSMMRFFEVGQLIDIGTIAAPNVVASGRTITAVNVAGRTITISGAVVTTNNTTHRVFLFGNGGTTPQLETTGIQTAVAASGLYINLDTSAAPRWAAQVLDNGGVLRASSQLLFTQAVDDTYNASGKLVTDIWTTDGVFRNYQAQLTAQHVYNDGNFLAEGGISGLKIHSHRGAITAETDKDCPDNTAWGVYKPDWTTFMVRDWNWDKRTGSIMRPVSNQIAYEAVCYASFDFATSSRNANFKLADLLESNV